MAMVMLIMMAIVALKEHIHTHTHTQYTPRQTNIHPEKLLTKKNQVYYTCLYQLSMMIHCTKRKRNEMKGR